MKKILFLLLIVLTAASCTLSWEKSINDAVAKMPAVDGIVYEDVEFKWTPTKRLTMDIYLPPVFEDTEAQADEKYPVYVYIYGGAWIGGNKNMVRFMDDNLIADLRAEDIAVVAISYRFLTEVGFDYIAEDVTDAMNFIFENGANYHLETTKVALHGQSAGGHLALLYGLKNPEKIACIVDEFGPTNLVTLAEHTPLFSESTGLSNGILKLIPESQRYRNSPINFVNTKCPPIIFHHGDKDDIVPIQQSISLYNSLVLIGEGNLKLEWHTVAGSGHGFNEKVIGEEAIEKIRNEQATFVTTYLLP
jgi:acetyl esterase/lipase